MPRDKVSSANANRSASRGRHGVRGLARNGRFWGYPNSPLRLAHKAEGRTHVRPPGADAQCSRTSAHLGPPRLGGGAVHAAVRSERHAVVAGRRFGAHQLVPHLLVHPFRIALEGVAVAALARTFKSWVEGDPRFELAAPRSAWCASATAAGTRSTSTSWMP